MSQFQYFVPESAKTKSIKELQLEYAFEGTPADRDILGRGPDGGRGVMYCTEAAGCGFFPDKQDFRKVPGNPHGVYLVWNRDLLPTPDELARNVMLRGNKRRLGHHEWQCPIARSFMEWEGEIVPVDVVNRYFDISDDDEWSFGGVSEEHKALYDAMLAYGDHVVAVSEGDSERILDVRQLADLAVEILKTNYRISRIEVAVLQIFNADTMDLVLRSLIDEASAEAVKKKVEGDTGNLQAGINASHSQDSTHQHSPTS